MNHAIGLTLLFALAVGYLWLGIFLPIDFMDEGIIVYPSWRVAVGEVPYRDFQQLYAPSIFYLNGLLFKLFGVDLSVLRLFLLGVKATTCVLVYLCARQMARQSFALLAYASCVVLWGLIWPVATTPYPSHHATTLCLAGILIFLVSERRFLFACAAAGLCFGLAASFKQTFGAFAFLGLALFLLIDRGSWERPSSKRLEWIARASRWFVLCFSAAIAVFYLLPRNPFWNLVLLASPVLVLLGCLVWREARSEGDAESRFRSFWGTVVLSLGFVAPLACYAAYFASLGLADAVLFNTVTGIPSATNWIVPYPSPTTHFVLSQLACFGLFASAAIWRGRRISEMTRAARVSSLGALGTSFLSFTALVLRGWPSDAEEWWFWGTSDLLFSAPFAIVWISIAALIQDGKLENDAFDARKSRAQRRARLLFTCYGTMALLWLYPSGDIWHIVPLLPSCLPLFAGLLERFWRLPESHGVLGRAWGVVAGTLIAVLSVAVLLPAARDLVRERGERPAFKEDLMRATHVRGNSGQYSSYKNGGKVVRYLLEAERKDEALFVLSTKPLLYFLTDRKSLVQEFGFVLYLTSFGLIEAESARELVDEDLLVQRLRAARPLIIDDYHDEGAKHVRETFPKLADFVSANYRIEKKFGDFHVLRWNPAPNPVARGPR